MSDIAAWLDRLELGKYADVFIENDIDIDVLAELSDAELKELGVSLGDRKRLLKAIAAAGHTETSATEAVGGTAEEPGISKTQAERRQLTVMFCDLVGSTALSVRFDPEDLREIINGYQACCEGIIERLGGYVARYMGDGLLVYFGYPQADEHDPERAVRAGLEIVTTVKELKPRPDLNLQTRIGIATGEVVVGDRIGKGAAQEEAVVGETPNLAARLQSLAEPDSVVIAEATQRRVGNLFEYADLGRHRLKGFTEPTQAWRVVGERAVDSRFEATHAATELTPLIGREEEVDLLRRRWQQVKAGEGQVVLLSGEPGIGKSRLTQALREQLTGEPHTLLRYYCTPYYRNSALYPVITQLERAARLSRDDPLEEKLTKLEALLAQSEDQVPEVAPLFAALLSLPVQDRYPPLDLSPQQQKEKTLDALAAQLIGLAHHKPVLMIFEDLHWLDPTSLEWLERLVERIQTVSVLVLLTFRPGFTPPWTGVPHVTALTLNRLNPQRGVEIVNQLTGGKPLPPEVLEQIVAKTDGVPLFVEELTKTVLEAGFLQDAGDRYTLTSSLPPLAVPSTLQDSLMARLDRLAPVKEVAQMGAVIGRQFSLALLAAVSPRAAPALQDALAQLMDAELIYRRGTPPEATYTFKHALIQDTAYNSLLRAQRQTLHARLAQVFEERFPETAEIEPELLAHHYTGAGLAEPAIAYWQKAGERAIQRSANAEAIEHLTQGLEGLKTLPDSPERDRKELALQLSFGLALMAVKGQAAPEVGSTYARARELSRPLGDSAQRFPVLWGSWRYHLMRAELRTAREFGEQCLNLALKSQDVALTLAARFALGGTLLFMGEYVPAQAHFEQAVPLYDVQQHRSLAFHYGQDPGASTLSYLGWTLWPLGYPEQALKRSREALTLSQALCHPLTLTAVTTYVAVMHGFCRNWPAVRTQAETGMALSSEHGFPHILALGRALRGWAVAQQQPENGVAQIKEGIAATQAIGATTSLPWKLAWLVEAHGEAGQTEAGLTTLAEALALVAKTGEGFCEAELHRLKGELLLRRGDPEAVVGAEASFRQSLAIARRQSAKSWELRTATSLARLWREQGKRQEARDLLAPVYNGFTEGFDTADLKDAKELLDELA